jgi:hypothetical protein
MNHIDKIVTKAIRDYKKREGKWATQHGEDAAVVGAVNAYRAQVPPEQFDLELLASNYWGRCNVGTSANVMRRVVLRLLDKLK